MPCWFYDKKALLNTPSIQDGINHETECEYRKEGTNLIIQIGSQMELGYNTLATGIVYFHRFYMFHSFKTFSPYVTACCCLFLAGKAEETPKKSKDIIKIAKKFLSEDKIFYLGENPREEVMIMEKILLQTLKFDLKVRHPYIYLLRYIKCLKGDKRRKQKMIQMAWTFINDSLCTTLSIQWEPEIIAIAVMHLAGKLVRFKVLGWSHRKPSHTHWWEIFVEDLNLEVVEDICHQVLDLYSPLSRYYVVDSPQPAKLVPKSSIVQSDSSENIEAAAKDPRHEDDASTAATIPAISLKDPRLESRSVFVNSHFNINTLNTPALVTSLIVLPENVKLTPSPATPTGLQPMDQSVKDNPQIFTNFPNIDPPESLRFPPFVPKFDASEISSSTDNVDDWQQIKNRSLANGNKSNDYPDNRMMRNRGFGCANNHNSDDCSENRPMRSRGLRNYGRNNRGGFGQNFFRRQNFENNNHGNSDDHNENQPLGNKGFGNSSYYDNRSYNDNKLLRNRGFGNTNSNTTMSSQSFGNATCNDDRSSNDNRLIKNRGFGNANNNDSTCDDITPFENRDIGSTNFNDDGNRMTRSRGFGNVNNNKYRYNETKSFRNRGFGNSNNYNNNSNGNDSRPRMMYNRGNRFQRSNIYPRRFNNNYENDRYSHNDTNRDTSKGFISDAPGKMTDKQRFYHPSIVKVEHINEKVENANLKVEEEESWD